MGVYWAEITAFVLTVQCKSMQPVKQVMSLFVAGVWRCMAPSNAYFLDNNHQSLSSDTNNFQVRQAGADKNGIRSDCALLSA